MQISEAGGRFTVICDRAELALVAEGLYAVESAGRRCLEQGAPDEFDRPALEAELALLSSMQTSLMPSLGERPVFGIVDGGLL